MNSSITTAAPAAPWAPPNISSMAACAAWTVSATTTPLPAASPSALTTIGAPWAVTWARAEAALSKRAQAAVGAPAASQISLVKLLEASSWAAAAEGPKARIPASVSASATPAASGASGPMITKSIASSAANPTTRLGIAGIEGGAFRHGGNACISGCHDQPVAFRVLRHGPGQRMFAPATAQNQDVHAPAPL